MIRELAGRLSRANPWAVDLGLTLLVQLAVTMPFVLPREAGLPPVTWASYAITTAAVVPLVWRRRRPVTVLVVILLVGGLYKVTLDGPGQPLPYAGLIAAYTVALQCPARVRAAVGVISVAVIAASVGLETGSARELSFTLFCACAAYVLGGSSSPGRPIPRPSRTARRSWNGRTGSRPNRPWPVNGPGSPGRCTTSSPMRSAS